MSNPAWKSLVNKNVKELRFILCQNGPKSAGMRNWINSNFVELKTNNPDPLLLIRECSNVDPMVLARYDFGVERKVLCEYASQEEIEEIVSTLVLDAEKVNNKI